MTDLSFDSPSGTAAGASDTDPMSRAGIAHSLAGLVDVVVEPTVADAPPMVAVLDDWLSLPAVAPIVSVDADRLAAQRRVDGRIGGCVMVLGALTAFGVTRIVSHPGVTSSFDLVALVSFCVGVICLIVPWNELSVHWLRLLPLVATVEVALGVRLAGAYGGIAATYYVFIVAYAAYAFRSRVEIAASVALAAGASALPVLYLDPRHGMVAAHALVRVLLLVVIAGIITALREGLESRQRELEDLTVRDPLTGVGNYRLLADRMDYEISRHRRSGTSMTVMLLDLDGFKHVNDTYGHLIGDRVLCEVARALSTATRTQDTLARQGGDEFSILAPDTTTEQARVLATRAQRAVAAATNGRVTTTVGWATYPTPTADPSRLLAVADEQLRGAKRDGRWDPTARTANPRTTVASLVQSAAPNGGRLSALGEELGIRAKAG
jgi:diguanylate cyclase (GGDEF)-like protein